MARPRCVVCGAELEPIPGKRGYFCPNRDGEVHQRRLQATFSRLRRREAGRHGYGDPR